MIDLKYFRDNEAAVREALRNRLADPSNLDKLRDEDQRHRKLRTQVDDCLAERNVLSVKIGQRKRQNEPVSDLLAETENLKVAVHVGAEMAKAAAQSVDLLLQAIPNIPMPDVPRGIDETHNEVVRTWGEPPKFDFTPKDHIELGERLGLNFERAVKMSGSRFSIMTGVLARLERALGQFMLDCQVARGYVEAAVPLLVNRDAMIGTGQLPKFENDLFKTTDDRYLISTAEVSLTNMIRNEIILGDDLPLRLVALTPCFRSEAGASGRDTRGLIRQHQFNKVELVAITTEETAHDEHLYMLESAERILQALELPYRVVLLCDGDMGFSARKTYDLEVWMPGQNAYREISSISYCGDFQARRMDARYRPQASAKGVKYVHTLNGSGVAVGRALAALLENHQDASGALHIPAALAAHFSAEVI